MTGTRTCNVCRRDLPVAAFGRAFGVCDDCHPVAWADLMRDVEARRALEALLGRRVLGGR